MPYKFLAEANLKGKKVLLRAGFDVPLDDGKVADTTRIEAMLPTVNHILDAGGSVIIMAHQGRPKGEVNMTFSQQPVADALAKLLGKKVKFTPSCRGDETKAMIDALEPGDVLLLENLRFDPAEKSKNAAERDEFGKELASYADVYVNDAFTNCHRDHASMTSVPQYLPSYIGLQLQQEINYLEGILDDPARPVTLIVSGAKMETKVPVIKRFLPRGDDVLLGGCIANTFVAARGFDVGESKYESTELGHAQEIMLLSEAEQNAMVHVPRDFVVATAPAEDAEKLDLPAEDIGGDMKMFDIGKVTIERYKEVIAKSGLIIWNGPLGLYEYNRFSHATKRIAEAVADATQNGATSIIGGGDTIDFHKRYNYPLDAYTFVSTGGGAMLEILAGKKLPALQALQQ